MQTVEYWIEQLQLEGHQEGGYFKQILKSHSTHDGRALYTSIYFLLTSSNPSHFHRLTADEVWYFHEGAPLTVHMIYPDGRYETIELGKDIVAGQQLQAIVPKNVIFGSTVEEKYALVSCMVSPGFEYEDFELFKQDELLTAYPEHREIIERLTID